MDENREERTRDAQTEGVLLLEGWMFGALLYPCAMDTIAKVPPAND